MVIMWVLLVVALAFVILLRVMIVRMRKFERLAAERKAQVAAKRAAAASAAQRRGVSGGGGAKP